MTYTCVEVIIRDRSLLYGIICNTMNFVKHINLKSVDNPFWMFGRHISAFICY